MILRDSGTFGDVYETPTRDVVKKYRFMDTHGGLPPDFLREMSCLTVLQSSGCVPEMLDVDAAAQSITMTKYDSNLAQFLRSSRSNYAINKIIYRIAECLFEAHSRGIIHRDVKTPNILVNIAYNEITEMVLADWGSSSVEGWCDMDDPECYIQSLHIRSPEIILGTGVSSAKMDVWSLGILFLGMAYNYTTYFSSRNEIGLLFEIFELIGTPSQYQHIFPTFSRRKLKLEPAATDLIFRMLEFDPTKRCDIVEVLNHPYFAGVRGDTVWTWPKSAVMRKRMFREEYPHIHAKFAKHFAQTKYNPRSVALAYHFYQTYKINHVDTQHDRSSLLNACCLLAEKVSETTLYIPYEAKTDTNIRAVEIELVELLQRDMFQLNYIALSKLPKPVCITMTPLAQLSKSDNPAKLAKIRWVDANYIYTYVKYMPGQTYDGWTHHYTLATLPRYSVVRQPRGVRSDQSSSV